MTSQAPVIRPDVADFLRHLAERGSDPVLDAMHAEARERGFPIVGPEVGRLLAQLVHLSGARRVFELGSGFGYSTLWFARAVGEGGVVHHTDGSEDNSRRARAYLEQAGVAGRVRFGVGDARDLLRGEPGPFDIIFCDIDKEQYPSAWPLMRERVRRGGAIVIDNLVWSGRVAAGDTSPSTEGIRRYLDLAYGDDAFLTSLMPVRDGVGISVRLR